MKSVFMMLWGIWDYVYYVCNRMQYVSKENNLFRIVKKKYKGPPLLTKDGTWIREGDEIVKLHIYNYGLAKKVETYKKDFKLALSLRNEVLQSLSGLSQHLYSSPQMKGVVAIMGTSMLNRGASRLGFTLYDVQQSLFQLNKVILYKMIYLLVHPEGMKYLLQHGDKLETKHMVMSTQKLFSIYLQRDEVK